MPHAKARSIENKKHNKYKADAIVIIVLIVFFYQNADATINY